MKKISQTIVACAALLATPLATAQAAVIPFGTITGISTNNSRSWMNSVSGSFTDYATFTTINTTNIVASITNSYASSVLFISGLTLSLYSGTLGSGSLIATATSSTNTPAPASQSVDLFSLGQVAGDYYLAVSGTTADSPSYGGSLAVVSTVPLPASAPLFGGALMAVGIVGYGVKKRKKALAPA